LHNSIKLYLIHFWIVTKEIDGHHSIFVNH